VLKQAVDDVRTATTGAQRRVIAVGWAEVIAALDAPERLRVLLDEAPAKGCDVAMHCITRRARTLLRINGLSELDRLMDLTVAELWRLPDCGRVSVIEILTAALLALVDDRLALALVDEPLPGMETGIDSRRLPMEVTSCAPTQNVSDPLLDLLEKR
jgi:hypothetical protein